MSPITPSPTPTDETAEKPHGQQAGEVPGAQQPSGLDPEPVVSDPNGPISFVPHIRVASTARLHPLRIRTGRFGDLDEHELVRLLDSLEDERARARFRESVYLSVFIWIAIALTALFGPKYLWHAPRVVLPSEVLRQRELMTLTAPTLNAPRLRPTPPSVDAKTLDRLRSTAPKTPPAPSARPLPNAPQPAPAEAAPTRTQPTEPPPPLQPSTAPPNLPSSPAPQPVPQPTTRTPPPVVAEAPHPQPAKPNFGGLPQSASDSIQQAIHGATRGGTNGGGAVSHNRGGTSLGMGPAEILSDTQGVNFQPYLRRILQEIYDQWIPLIPEEARPPLRKSGVTMIRFTILPDGTIGAMHLDGSTHDDALNKAAWGSITSVGQFPALPSQFHGPNLELRIHYLVNQDTE